MIKSHDSKFTNNAMNIYGFLGQLTGRSVTLFVFIRSIFLTTWYELSNWSYLLVRSSNKFTCTFYLNRTCTVFRFRFTWNKELGTGQNLPGTYAGFWEKFDWKKVFAPLFSVEKKSSPPSFFLKKSLRPPFFSWKKVFAPLIFFEKNSPPPFFISPKSNLI